VSREVWSALAEPTVNLTSRIAYHPAGARPTPAALLGREHPFVRDTERLLSVGYACAAVSVVLLGATAALVAGWSSAPAIVLAAAAAEIALLARTALLVASRRIHAFDLIAGGHDDLPIPAVERLTAKLRSARYRQRLISSIEDLIAPRRRPFDVATVPWEFMGADLVAGVRRELDVIARLLRNSDASVQGVALMRQLLFDGTSSLHGHDIRALREELARVRFLLEAGHSRRPCL
jgi:hypothetical protein